MAEHVFGVGTGEVRAAAGALTTEAHTLDGAASAIQDCVPDPSSLPGGRTAAAARDGAGRVSDAVRGESTVLDVAGGDLVSFARAVDSTEARSADSFATATTGGGH